MDVSAGGTAATRRTSRWGPARRRPPDAQMPPAPAPAASTGGTCAGVPPAPCGRPYFLAALAFTTGLGLVVTAAFFTGAAFVVAAAFTAPIAVEVTVGEIGAVVVVVGGAVVGAAMPLNVAM